MARQQRNREIEREQTGRGAARRRREEQLREERRIQRQNRRGNKQIMVLTYGLSLLFLCMLGYFVWFMVTQSGEIINNPYNKRQDVLAKKVRRGEIRSAGGEVLARTETDENGNDTREYPYDKVFCHVVGRITNSMTGIEGDQCYPLLTSHINPLEQLINTFRGEKNPGDNIVTTLDAGLQTAAYEALGDHRGAVVVIEPSTGKILAMVSKPAYDPNTVEEDWDSLVEDSGEESMLLNRATQGLYPPGSTFKLLTGMEYMIEHPKKYQNFQYQCKGSDSFSGNVINCYDREVHGTLDLESALAKSCNGAFAKIGTTLDIAAFRKLTERFLFNKPLPVSFEYNKSRFSLDEDSDMGELTQTVMGQGKTMITPLENAMIVAAIANSGEMMVPYVIDHIENAAGQTVTAYSPRSKGRIVKKWVAEGMGEMMEAVVKSGTGSSLQALPYPVAGKTGSAEFDSEGTSHAWFVGFAPAENPKIAVSVVVEGAGTGSQYAVPVAQQVFGQYWE